MKSGVLATLAAVAGVASASTPVTFTFDDISVSNSKSCGFKTWNTTEVYQGVQWTNMVYTLNRTETSACSGDPVHLPPYPDGLFPGWGEQGPIGVAKGALKLNAPDLSIAYTGDVSFYLRTELNQEELDAGDATQLVKVYAGEYEGGSPIQTFETQTGIDGNLFEWYHVPINFSYRFLEIQVQTWLIDRPEKYRDAVFYIDNISFSKV